MSELNKDDLFTIDLSDDSESEHIAAPQYSYWRSVFRKFFSSKLAIFMMILSGIVILLAIFQPMISGYDPNVTPNINRPEMKYIRPNATYWFGTDDVGNSLFDAVWKGTATSLFVSFMATAIVMVIFFSVYPSYSAPKFSPPCPGSMTITKGSSA